MNLCSCDNCGVVLDKTKLPFVDEADFYPDGEVDCDVASWSSYSRRYVAMVKCPVCGSEVLDESR